MCRSRIALVMLAVGVGLGALAATKGIDASLFVGKEKEDAGAGLLAVALQQAGKGSWERIAVGRVHYLSGRKAEGQALFDAVTSGRPEASDWMRIGRIYGEAGEWDKAKSAFDVALRMSPKDAPWLAEVGGFYNLAGERDQAEELFRRAFAVEANEFWNTVNVAGSYYSVRPQ